MSIKKSSLEWIIILTLFVLSFFNTVTLFIFLLSLLVFFTQREIGAIKILVILTMRTYMNPGFAINIGELQYIKWMLIFISAGCLWLAIAKLSSAEINKIKWILILVSIFTIYHSLSAFAFSSLPVVATFKTLSYSIVFLGVLIGMGYTKDKFNWLGWVIKWFYLLFATSAFLVVHPIGYFKNGTGFQGITNQPNLFGILSVLFIALLLTNDMTKEKANKLHIFISLPLIFAMLILSDSRTALLSGVIVLATYFIILLWKRVTYLIAALFSLLTASLIIIVPLIYPYIMDYLYKGQSPDDILYSRENQLSSLLFNFQSNPLFGTGFAVPNLPYRSYAFSDDFVVEPGNIILAVLSYGGIIGFVIFASYIIAIIWSNKKTLPYNILLIMAPLLVNMGEMSFFSSNSSGILIYVFLSMYVFIQKDNNHIGT